MGFALFIIAALGALIWRAVGVVIISGPKGWITLGVMTVAVIASNTINAVRDRRE